jgi:hypothetical protein
MDQNRTVITGEINELKIFERVVARKLYGQVKEERWRIRKNKEIQEFCSDKLL